MGEVGSAIRRRSGSLAALALAVASLAAVAAPGASPSRLVARQVELKLEGTHAAGAGYHEGTFTASAPLCPSGTWLGDSEEDGDGVREFTCADRSGTFTTDFVGDAEHETGATAPWAITGGTGKWVKLRGAGTATTDQSTGPGQPPIDFRSTWTGLVDFDAAGPSLRVTRATVVRAGRSWKVSVAFTSFDNVRANAVTFRVTATSGQFFAAVNGTVAAGKGRATFVVRRSEAADELQLGLHVFDPWENETAARKLLKLR